MKYLILIHEDKDEELALGLRDFLKALGVENVLMFAQEPGSGLSPEEMENRYFSKAESALILVPADPGSGLAALAGGTAPESKLLIKYFGKNSGGTFTLYEKGAPGGEKFACGFDPGEAKSIVAALTRLAKWVKDSGILRGKDDPAGDADSAVETLYAGLDGLLKSFVLDIGGQDKQQIGLEAFLQVAKAKHNKSAEETGAIKDKLVALGLLEESRVMGKVYLRLTRKGRGIASLEGKNRPKSLIHSVFKQK